MYTWAEFVVAELVEYLNLARYRGLPVGKEQMVAVSELVIKGANWVVHS